MKLNQNVGGAAKAPSGFLFFIYKFFGSLKLAVILLFFLIVTFSVGTIIESRHGTDAAKILVYEANWFVFLGFFFALNLTASAVDRLPWKKKHIPFVMTHAGIITVLAGSLMTKVLMVDAQMPIEEGRTEHRITLPQPVLYIFRDSDGAEWPIDLTRRAFPWEGSQALEVSNEQAPLPFELKLTHFYPKGRLYEELQEAPEGSPAIKVSLKNSFVNQKVELVSDHPDLGMTQLGPATVRFTNKKLDAPQSQEAKEAYLEFKYKENTFQIPVTEKLQRGQAYPIEGTPYEATFEGFYKNAIIDEGKLTERDVDEGGPENQGGDNPAVVMWIKGQDVIEKHTAFGKFPEFPTLHGQAEGKSEIRIYYRMPGMGIQGGSHELRFVNDNQKLIYQIKKGSELTTGEVEIGKDIPTGWMDLTFLVEEYLPHVQMSRYFTPEPNTSERIDAYPAIQIQIVQNNESKNLWLAQGALGSFSLGNERFHFMYGQQKIKLDFKIHLQDFIIKHYQGTSKPASFESDVVVMDDFKGVEREVNISMNEPLDYGGYRFFQASYMQPGGGEPDISIFSVVKDPGIPVKYLGTIIMISGITLMFFQSRLSFKKGQKK